VIRLPKELSLSFRGTISNGCAIIAVCLITSTVLVTAIPQSVPHELMSGQLRPPTRRNSLAGLVGFPFGLPDSPVRRFTNSFARRCQRRLSSGNRYKGQLTGLEASMLCGAARSRARLLMQGADAFAGLPTIARAFSVVALIGQCRCSGLVL